jgi:hypothetical protein
MSELLSKATEWLDAPTSEVLVSIAHERRRQLSKLGWSRDHDDSHTGGELARAAACFAAPRYVYSNTWPWGWAAEPEQEAPDRRQLVKAAALLVAEIERMDRLNDKEQS